MRYLRSVLFMLVFLSFAGAAFAQGDSPPVDSLNWLEIAALAINTVGVTLAVRLVTLFLPGAPAWAKGLLTLLAGPALLAAQTALSPFFGFDIDFGPLIAVIAAGSATSVAAMVPFMVGKAQGRGRKR